MYAIRQGARRTASFKSIMCACLINIYKNERNNHYPTNG
nr:MAG TPA: hypothetical protein [Caudoviricetes sp.]